MQFKTKILLGGMSCGLLLVLGASLGWFFLLQRAAGVPQLSTSGSDIHAHEPENESELGVTHTPRSIARETHDAAPESDSHIVSDTQELAHVTSDNSLAHHEDADSALVDSHGPDDQTSNLHPADSDQPPLGEQASPDHREQESAAPQLADSTPHSPGGPEAPQRLPGTEKHKAALGIKLSGDSYFREHEYAKALKRYQAAHADGTLAVTPETSYRMGVCTMHLGGFDLASDHLMSAIQNTEDEKLATRARRVLAAVSIERGELDRAASLLAQLLLNQEPGELATRGNGYYVSTMLCETQLRRLTEATATQGPASNVDHGTTAPLFRVAVLPVSGEISQALEDHTLIMRPVRWSRTLPEDDGGSAVTPPKSSDIPSGFSVVNRVAGDADSTTIRGNRAGISVYEVVNEACRICGWDTAWNSSAQESAQYRMGSFFFPELSLSVFLDLVTEGTGVTWTLRDGSIQLLSVDETDEAEHWPLQCEAARRMTLWTIKHATVSSQRGEQLFRVGLIETLLGDTHRAALQFENAMRESSRLRCAGEVRFNLAKLKLAQAHIHQAEILFSQAVDHSRGETIEGLSYLFLGRLLLENEQPKKSISPLTRGLAVLRGRDGEGIAAALLVEAYLLSGNAGSANKLLYDRKALFKDSPLQNRAAFLSAYSRYRMMSDPARRDRDAKAVLEALAHLNANDCFGHHVWWLMSSAYEDLGFSELAAEMCRSALSASTFPGELADTMRIRLADSDLRLGRVEAAAELLADSPGLPSSPRLTLMRARIALKQGNHDQALKLCQQLTEAESPPDVRRAAFSIMGRILQRRGEHRAAALSYAGIGPE